MAFESGFADILQKKMGFPEENLPKSSSYTVKKRPHSPVIPPLFMDSFRWTPPSAGEAYLNCSTQPQIRNQAENPEAPIPKPNSAPEIFFSIGELGLDNATPFMTLTRHGADLDEGRLSEKQLKKQYRKLAKIFHPDNGHRPNGAEIFQECTEAYRILEAAIASKSKTTKDTSSASNDDRS